MWIAALFNVGLHLVYLSLAYLFGNGLPRRKGFTLRLVGMAFLNSGIVFGLTFVPFLQNNIFGEFSLYLTFFLLGLGSILFCFRIRLSPAAFLGVLAYNTRHLAYLIWQALFLAVSDFLPELTMVSWQSFLMVLASAAIIIPIVFLILHGLRRYPDVALAPFRIIIFLFFSLLADNLVNLLGIHWFGSEKTPWISFLLNAIGCIWCAMIYIVMFSFAKEKYLQGEIASIEQMRHQEAKQYEINKKTIDLINIKTHDLRHQIRELKRSGAVVTKETLDEIEEATRIYNTRMKTGNDSLDVILQEKSLICKDNEISFNCIIDGAAMGFMRESDIYSLFGNIVDNAIEATRNVTNPSKRVITLKISKVAGGVFAYEENPFSGEIYFKDGLPASPKDHDYHGFGMKSIKMISDAYYGTMDISAKNGLFSIGIYFDDGAIKKITAAREKQGG